MKMVDFLILLKQTDEPKTIEQMKSMNAGVFKEFIIESIEKRYVVICSKTSLGIDLYRLSDLGNQIVSKEIEKRNANRKW